MKHRARESEQGCSSAQRQTRALARSGAVAPRAPPSTRKAATGSCGAREWRVQSGAALLSAHHAPQCGEPRPRVRKCHLAPRAALREAGREGREAVRGFGWCWRASRSVQVLLREVARAAAKRGCRQQRAAGGTGTCAASHEEAAHDRLLKTAQTSARTVGTTAFSNKWTSTLYFFATLKLGVSKKT